MCFQNDNSKIVWLTFDDSLWDFYDNAYPILQKYGAKATNNVITSTVGNSGNLSLDEMLEMKANGMSFQDHTVTHPDLSASDNATQTSEMEDSKTISIPILIKILSLSPIQLGVILTQHFKLQQTLIINSA